MPGPVAELRRFLRAALLVPVEPPVPAAPDAAGGQRRRRVVVALTLAVGTLTLALALRIEPGDPAFYGATLALAAIWVVGALASGPLRLGSARTRDGDDDGRAIVQSLALAALLLGVFLLGALAVAQVPWLRENVLALLDHASDGVLGIVVVTVLNGVAEEIFFRGALYDALPRRHALLMSTLLYALTTVGSGVPLLVLAAAALGLVTGLQRRVTGGVLGPIVTHITWSTGMLLLLPLVLTP